MKRLMTASLLAIGLFSTAAIAAPPAQNAEPAEPSATASVATDEQAAKHVDRHCLRHTGSHVAMSNSTDKRDASAKSNKSSKRCIAASGRVYGRDDLERTGEIGIADALRKLDPAIR